MNVAWFRFRCEMRHRWGAVLALILLAGLGAGAVFAAAAGARRTDSTFDRVVRTTRAADAAINPNESIGERWSAIRALPQVEDLAVLHAFGVLPTDENGEPTFDWFNDLIISAESPNALHTIERPNLIAGRVPDPDRAEEILVNQVFARNHGANVGDRIPVLVYNSEELSELAENGGPLLEGEPFELVITGIDLTLEEAIRSADDPNLTGRVFLSPAFERRFPGPPLFEGGYVRLHNGVDDLPAFQRAVAEAIPDEAFNYQTTDSTRTRVDHAVRPYVLALWLFAALAALAVVTVVGQTLARQHRLANTEMSTLMALGCRRRVFVMIGAIRGLVVGIGAALVAVVTQYVASALMPLGPLHEIDPARGIGLDATVVGVGVVLVVAATVAHGAYVSSRTRTELPRSSRTSDSVAALGAPVEIVNGVRFALTSGRGAAAVPVRSTLLGLGVAIAALSGTLVYASGLHQFVTTPRLYGWAWDYMVSANDESNDDGPAVAANEDVVAATPGLFAQLLIDDETVGAVGIEPTGDMKTAEVVHGRVPEQPGEVALGTRTMHDLGTSIGEDIDVHVGDQTKTLRVVGTVVLPRFAPYPQSEPTGLGIGALMHYDDVDDLYDNEGVGVTNAFYLVNVRDPATTTAAALTDALYHGQDEDGVVLGPQRPNDVLSYDRLQNTPLALAGLLVLLGTGTLVHLLVTAVRGRRRDIAVLRSAGSTARQIRLTVVVQALTLVGVATAIALPVGIVGGRLLWTATADWLGIPAEPRVPVFSLAGVVVVTLVFAVLVALIPARTASRLRPAEILRSE